MIEVNIFPTQEVSAIGRLFPGSAEFSSAFFLGIKFTTAVFHALGTEDDSQHELYRLSRAGRTDGQFLKMHYES